MNRLTWSVLLAAATLGGWPAVGSADPWTDIGPASAAFNYNGYIDPWTGRAGNGAYDRPGYWSASSRRTFAPTVYGPFPQGPVASSPQTWAVPSSSYVPMTPVQEQAASIQLRVPENAEVWIDNYKTSQTGSVRTFVSPNLEPGKPFTYAIHARWTDARGKVFDQTKAVGVQAGQWSRTEFGPEATKGTE